MKKYNVEQLIQEALHNEWIGRTIYYDFYLDTNKIMVSDNVEPKHNNTVLNNTILDVKVETILGKHHVYFYLNTLPGEWVEVISFFRNTF